jgi:transcription antitermination factor NusG
MVMLHQMPLVPGDRIRINCGSLFDGYEGTVVEYPTRDGLVRFAITVFGRGIELVLDPSQIEVVATQSSDMCSER